MIFKMQHYVPQFYLRNFSTKDGDKYIINCFDKIEDKVFKVNVKNVAGEKFFHDLEKGREQYLERKLGELEKKFAKALRRLNKCNKIDNMSEYQKQLLSLFIAIQMERTKERREYLRDMVTQIHSRLSKENLTENLRRQIEDSIRGDTIKSMHLENLIEHSNEFSKIIFDMKWILVINKTEVPFIISDNPISLNNELTCDKGGTIGLTCSGISVHIPISPNRCLIVCDPITYHYLQNKVDVENRENVIFENGLQILNSTRHVFSIDADFSLAKEIIEKNPRHNDPDRKRVDVQ